MLKIKKVLKSLSAVVLTGLLAFNISGIGSVAKADIIVGSNPQSVSFEINGTWSNTPTLNLTYNINSDLLYTVDTNGKIISTGNISITNNSSYYEVKVDVANFDFSNGTNTYIDLNGNSQTIDQCAPGELESKDSGTWLALGLSPHGEGWKATPTTVWASSTLTINPLTIGVINTSASSNSTVSLSIDEVDSKAKFATSPPAIGFTTTHNLQLRFSAQLASSIG